MTSLRESLAMMFPFDQPKNVTDKSIVYEFAKHNELAGRFESPDAGSSRTRVVIMERSVMVITQVFVQGNNKHSGAEYKRWDTTHTLYYSLKQEREGVPILRIYSHDKIKKKRVLRNATPTTLNLFLKGLDESNKYQTVIINRLVAMSLNHIYDEVATVKWGGMPTDMARKVLTIAYPTTLFFPEMPLADLVTHLSTQSTLWRGTSNVQSFVQRNFGKKTVRRDVLRSLKNVKNPVCITNLTLFKNLVPVEWVVRFLQEPGKYSLGTENALTNNFGGQQHHQIKTLRTTIKNFFKLLTVQQKRKFFFAESSKATRYNTFPDILKLIDRIGEEDLKSNLESLDFTDWNSLHDSLSILHRRLSNGFKAIPQTETMEKLNNAEFIVNDVVHYVKSPESTENLLNWGNKLVNCIASYGHDVINKRTMVFAVYEKESNKLVANIEFNNKTIYQFVGLHNRQVDDAMFIAFRELLDEKEIPQEGNQTYKEQEAARNMVAPQPDRNVLPDGLRDQFNARINVGGNRQVDEMVAF